MDQTGMTETRKYKIAAVQMSMGADPEANFAAALRHVREAARLGANVVCLPELFRTQYFCQREDLHLFDLAEPIPGPSTEKLGAVAREAGVVIVASLFERRAPGLYHNTAVTLGPDGTIISVYRKMHIPDDPLYYEKYYFAPGDLGFKAVDTTFGRMGTLVCWDQWYPEGARLTALQGAEVLFYPTAIGWHPAEKDEFGAAQYDAWRTIQRSHAIANGVYVAAVNRVGKEHGDVLGNRAEGPGLEFWGGSFIADPFGRIIAKASHENEEILVAEVDLKLIEDTRRNWPFLRDRRIDAYAPIAKRYLDSSGGWQAGALPSEKQIAYGDVAGDLISGPRYRVEEIPHVGKGGVYAFFLQNQSALPTIEVGESGLIYIGKSNSNVGKRNPLFHEHSSAHSFRRSLGALLRKELDLYPVPRSDGKTASYRFTDSGEEKLTSWMERNLSYSYVALDGDITGVEEKLINQFCPPINLTNTKNRFRASIREARLECQNEAAAASGSAQ
jgi:N-carbamoylputrescine amidase